MIRFLSLALLCLFVFSSCNDSARRKELSAKYQVSALDKETFKLYSKTDEFLQTGISLKRPIALHPSSKIDTIIVDAASGAVTIDFNDAFAYTPFRERDVRLVEAGVLAKLGKSYQKKGVTILANGYPLADLVPNYYRTSKENYDRERLARPMGERIPLVRRLDAPWRAEMGMSDYNIALWGSHGWYYEPRSERWEWQRARVFQSIEDLLPTAFVHGYLLPMLENAGAQVFMPRERDLQTNMVIVDNDALGDSLAYSETGPADSLFWQTDSGGFAPGFEPYEEGVNPFHLGTTRRMKSDTSESAVIQWTPVIPESGEYAVYVSYTAGTDRVTDAEYTVHHEGGTTRFLVNQQISGSTWNYLGTFFFAVGSDSSAASVILSNVSKEFGRVVSADAVRFGGGMGDVARNGSTSGRPRFVEAARYYMQFAGMPDSLVYNVTNQPDEDYKDDYRGRGEWANYLRGHPFGPNAKRDVPGLGIPIDLSLAFHTDAGQNKTKTIGTLLIYATQDGVKKDVFPDGVRRLANRDFADILQTEIVDDIRRKYDPNWRRRSLWDKQYSEAFRPNVPGALLELLSHHNLLDMKFALDPRFRFDSSRSIYKAMLKFLATQHQRPFVVQPLPVTHFALRTEGTSGLQLSWQAQDDSLEASAVAEKFIVYTRLDGGGWDNGMLVDGPVFTVDSLADSVIYSFKVAAVNEGGTSFPSEILSACRIGDFSDPVMIVNGFDRIAAPAVVETGDFAGFADFVDQGVPDRYDLSYTGPQFDFMRSSKWRGDDAPGWGASYADYETRVIPGNTFDYPYVHGEAIRAAGRSFISCSDEAVADSLISLKAYSLVNLILGEERLTGWPQPGPEPVFEAFPENMRQRLTDYCAGGGNLFLSGSYIGTDLLAGDDVSDEKKEFANNVLHYRWVTNHATRGGRLAISDSLFLPITERLEINTGYHPDIYTAEAPDAIAPRDVKTKTILRYAENNIPAATAYAGLKHKVIAFGFPFETILGRQARAQLMQQILAFFE